MTNKTFYILAALLIAASVIFWINMFRESPQPAGEDTTTGLSEYEGEISMTMYHSEGCECCVKWADYLEDHGVEVTSKKVNDINAVKQEHGVPGQLSACHTAIVEGYVVEGHVPIEDIRKLLGQQPDAIGISVPGMPPNSPGMDIPVDRTYQSVLFDAENITVFNTHQ